MFDIQYHIQWDYHFWNTEKCNVILLNNWIIWYQTTKEREKTEHFGTTSMSVWKSECASIFLFLCRLRKMRTVLFVFGWFLIHHHFVGVIFAKLLSLLCSEINFNPNAVPSSLGVPSPNPFGILFHLHWKRRLFCPWSLKLVVKM